MATVTSLDGLVGGHPEALRDIYLSGAPCDPVGLGCTRGRLLAFEPLARVHLLVRPLVAGVARSLSPWEGKDFESGGTAGANLILGRRTLRFRCEAGSSRLDGLPTLLLSHDGLDNAWPGDRLADELREVGPGVLLGPLLWRESRSHDVTPILWWGLSKT
ncbi:MAG: hypothetical protein FJ095_03790 [Deltaproteobacteria bacterium]|nr:hypothetical protein [Deltaproteobacteria bacterium]